MSAIRKKRMKAIALFVFCLGLISFCMYYFSAATQVKQKVEESYVCEEPYVYWTTYDLYGLGTEVHFEEPILSYRQGLVETENYYWYEGESISKKDVRCVTKGYYINNNDEIMSFKGQLVGKASNATYIIAEKDKLFYIVNDYLYVVNQEEKAVYLGGNVKQVLLTDANIYMITDFNKMNGKAAYIKIDAETLKVTDLLEVYDTDILYQVLDSKVYFKGENSLWQYGDYKDEVPYISDGIYTPSCVIEFKNDLVVFKQINSGAELGHLMGKDIIKGVALK